jgi:signal transduction histidine kinase
MKNSCAWLAGCIVFGLCLLSAGAEEPAPLLSIAAARAQQVLGDGGRVRVRGQITFSNQRLGVAFIQDETGGIGFDPRTRQKPLAKQGEWVELSGVPARRQGMIMILRHARDFGAPEVTAISPVGERIVPTAFDLNDAAEMRIDGLLTHVTGVIRRVVVGPEADSPLLIEISSPSGHAIARLPWQTPRPDEKEVSGWLNCVVTMNAVLVCQAAPPLLAVDAEALLLVPGRFAWTVQPQALDEVFARTPAALSNAVPVVSRSAAKNRLHIQGVVTAAKPRTWISLRTASGSVQVQTRQADVFEPGEKLSIACWPQSREGGIILLDGVCRRLGKETAPEPIQIRDDFMNHSNTSMELVTMTGDLTNHATSGGVPQLKLTLASGQSCQIHWQTFLTEEQASSITPGSRVNLTGLMTFKKAPPQSDVSGSYTVIPRGLSDVVVLRGPSWWTRARLYLAVWSLLGVVAIMVPTAMYSRTVSRRQERQLRHIELRAVAEEERRRIAREFHDSLQQQLAGAALHLETLKGALKAAPEMLPRLIEDTTAMIRHCQIEARHCIWDLRTDAPARESLAEALAEWLYMRGSQVSGVAVRFEAMGDLPPLGEDVPFQILRITQEAVNNALAHAAAKNIHVRLEGRANELLLEIRDDGRGFDPKALKQGHFGLHSQLERAQKIGAQLRFISPPDNGTHVSLCVPTHVSAYANSLRT